MKIAIVRLSALGDIIQSMVVLQFIKKKFPNSSIDWIVDSQFASILSGCNEIDNLIELNIKQIKKQKSFFLFYDVLRKLRRLEKYDKVFDFQGLIKSALVSRFIPAKERIGFDKNSIREKLASTLYSQKFSIPYEENVIMRYTGMINKFLKTNITKKDIDNKKSFFKNTKHRNSSSSTSIVLVLGASFPSKIYPVEKYAEIANSMNARFIAIWGSDKERKMALKLVSISKNVTIAKKLSLNELKELISTADLVIGSDTGPTHLSWALNVPSITIFGSTPMERNCYRTRINLAIGAQKITNPFNIDRIDSSIREIDPKNIVKLATGLLKE